MYFCDFCRLLTRTGTIIQLHQTFMIAKLLKKGLEHKIESLGLLLRHDNVHAFHLSQESCHIDSNKTKNFILMATTVQRICLIDEKLHFLHCSVQGVLNDLIKYFRPFSVFF